MSNDATEMLVSTETADGIQLHGILIQPVGSLPKPAIVWIHGFGANFYFAPYLRLGQALAAHQYAFIVGNTRGHDFGVMLDPKERTPYLGGAAWERLEESPFDVAGWIYFALRRGFAGTVLAGHSLGAVKAAAYQAQHQDPHVRGLVLASPPLRPSWNTRAYPAAVAQAEQLIAEGRPEELFAGPWGPVSAQTYLSLDRFKLDQLGCETLSLTIARLRCPLLVILGTQEEHVGIPNDLDVIKRNAVATSGVETHLIEGADHFYTEHESQVAAILAHWADTLSEVHHD
jgi:pimeloyl-ACP methyl ester carboxylesterase